MTLALSRNAQMQKMRGALPVDYAAGMSQQQIASKYGFSIGTVCRQMKILDIAVRAHPVRHGHHRAGRRSATYLSWDTMIQRCLNANNPNYRNYGGRGITVCEHWRKFANFLADMGERPPSLTLERRDTNGNYEPGNCSWVGRQAQLNNKRTNVFVEYDGKRLTLAQWSALLGVDYMTLWHRYRRAGTWPPR